MSGEGGGTELQQRSRPQRPISTDFHVKYWRLKARAIARAAERTAAGKCAGSKCRLLFVLNLTLMNEIGNQHARE